MIPKVIFSEGKKDWVKRPLLSNIEKILDYRGRTPKKLGLSWSDTGFLALSALNVKNGYIDFNADANYGDQELYDRWMGDNHLHKGQVVFTTEAPMGNVAQIPNDDLYILSQRTIAFEVKHHLIREDFLATLLRSPKIFNELTSLSSGGTAKGVSQKSLSKLKVCVPASLDEQQAIGSLFRTLDDLLSSYKDNLANYQSLKTTMLSKMFPKAGQTVPEIRLDGFEGEWKFIRLGKVLLEAYQGINTTSDKVEYSVSGIPILQAKHITNGQINCKDTRYLDMDIYEHYISKYMPKKGEILFANIGTIGPSVLVDTDELFLIAWNILKMSIKDNYSPVFIKLTLSLLDSKHIFERITTGNATKFINKDEIMDIRISVPSLPEQQAIGAYFSNLDNLINSHQEKISQLETLKKRLLQDMFI